MASVPRLRKIVAAQNNSGGGEKQHQSIGSFSKGLPGVISWSSKNVIARIICNQLHLIPYETLLDPTTSTSPSDLVGKVNLLKPLRYWEGLKWHHSGDNLVIWDGLGTLDIFQTLCANQLSQLYSTNVRAPLLEVSWFPSQRPVIFQPEKGIGRGPFLGPRNLVGNLGLITVTSSGYITILYQNHSNSFSKISCSLPTPYYQVYSQGNLVKKPISSASITYSVGGTTFLTISQPNHPSYTVFQIKINLTDKEPSIKLEFVTQFLISSANNPNTNIMISHKTVSLLGPFQILTKGQARINNNQSQSWFSVHTADLLKGSQQNLSPSNYSETFDSEITFCGYLDSFIMLGLHNGQIQLRPQNQPDRVLKSANIIELFKLNIFSKNIDSNSLGHLVHVELSANKCLLLIVTSTHQWFVFSLMHWLGQELFPESQMVSSLLVGLEQGTDLVDIVSYLVEKQKIAVNSDEAGMTNKQLISNTVNQVIHHWSTVHQPSPFSLQRILVLYTILHRYFPDGPGSITKFLLASRIQIARDMLCASLIGDAKKPNFDLENFTEMAPFATYALHCLVFIFRDLYIYYHTTTIDGESQIMQGPATPHLALLAHSSSARVLADVVLWLQMLHFQITQTQSYLPQHLSPVFESWMRNWSALPVDPKNILKFLSALLLHLNKVQRSPSNPFLIPSSFPPWAIEHFVKLKTNLGPQFETMGDALLHFDTRWLGLSVGLPLASKFIFPIGFSSTELDDKNLSFKDLSSFINNSNEVKSEPSTSSAGHKRLSIHEQPGSAALTGGHVSFANIPFTSHSQAILERLNISNHTLIQPALSSSNVSPSGQFSLSLNSPNAKRFKSNVHPTAASFQLSNDFLSQLNIQNGGNINFSINDDLQVKHHSSIDSSKLSPFSYPLICLRCRFQSNTTKKILGGAQPAYIKMIWVQKACPCGGQWVANHAASSRNS